MIDRIRMAAALAAALTAAACADDPAPEAAAPPPADEAVTRVAVDQALTAEIGRTHDGFVLSATGLAQGVGWRAARLRPVTVVAGPDGFIEFVLVAEPPAARDPGLQQRIRADTVLAPEQLAFARGARVSARAGTAETLFPAPPPPSVPAGG